MKEQAFADNSEQIQSPRRMEITANHSESIVLNEHGMEAERKKSSKIISYYMRNIGNIMITILSPLVFLFVLSYYGREI